MNQTLKDALFVIRMPFQCSDIAVEIHNTFNEAAEKARVFAEFWNKDALVTIINTKQELYRAEAEIEYLLTPG
jgi:hypothetical protein